MKKRGVGAVVLLASLTLVSEALGQAVGNIELTMKGEKCVASTKTDVTVDGESKVYWLVTNKCSTSQKVRVGIFHRNGTSDYYKVTRKCNAPKVDPKRAELVKCDVDLRCGNGFDYYVYYYSVCANQKILGDPELRVKGGGGLEDLQGCGKHNQQADAERECKQ